MFSSWWSNDGEQPPLAEANDLLANEALKSSANTAEAAPTIGGEASGSMTVGEYEFSTQTSLSHLKLYARSSSHLQVWGWSVACAVLYLPKETLVSDAEDLMNPDVAKVLQVKYVRGITGDQFRWVTKDSVEGNGFSGPAVDSGIEEFNPLYKDVTCGDAYTISYLPNPSDSEAQCSLSLNDNFLGAVRGRTISKAIFSVWFGQRVWFESMRDELLKGACAPSAVGMTE